MTTTNNRNFHCYRDKRFNADTLDMIVEANKIIGEYEEQGFAITLRQLYYQFVSRDLLPNVVQSYNRLGAAVNDGRLAGLISWTAIEDRGRNLKGLSSYSSPRDAMERMIAGYRLDRWRDQPFRPEVWVEKEALEGIIGSICNELHVDFFACRGYNSQSEQWRAGMRFANYIRKGQKPIVFHLGDHDPSGIDMTRDNEDRLSMFAGVPIQVVRLALNMDQVERYAPPPNPAKVTDSRFADYEARFGSESWELDALSPTVIRDLISDAVMRVRDEALWDAATMRETEDLETLLEFTENLEGE
jgi:hypothetical protein